MKKLKPREVNNLPKNIKPTGLGLNIKISWNQLLSLITILYCPALFPKSLYCYFMPSNHTFTHLPVYQIFELHALCLQQGI